MCLVVAVIEMGTKYSTCAFSTTYQLATYQHEIDIAGLIKGVNEDNQHVSCWTEESNMLPLDLTQKTAMLYWIMTESKITTTFLIASQ
jgi:hypothetical protein